MSPMTINRPSSHSDSICLGHGIFSTAMCGPNADAHKSASTSSAKQIASALKNARGHAPTNLTLSLNGIRREAGVGSLTRSQSSFSNKSNQSNMSTISAPQARGHLVWGDHGPIPQPGTRSQFNQLEKYEKSNISRWNDSSDLTASRENSGADDGHAAVVAKSRNQPTGSRARSISDASALPRIENCKRYRFVNEIGDGAFSRVWAGRDNMLNQDVALKGVTAHPNFMGDAKMGMEGVDVDREWNITTSLKHQNIIAMLDRFTVHDQHGSIQYLVCEYAEGGDLFDLLESGAIDHDASLCKQFATQIGEALVYCHSKGVVHNDIKLENMLIKNNTVKLCDFGLAGYVGEVRHGRPHGTCAYMAPELICVREHESYVVATGADVWSYAIVLFAMIFADLPWDEATRNDEVYTAFVRAPAVEEMHPWSLIAPELRQILLQCFSHISRRPSMTELVSVVSGEWLMEIEETSGCADTESHIASDGSDSGVVQHLPIVSAVPTSVLTSTDVSTPPMSDLDDDWCVVSHPDVEGDNAVDRRKPDRSPWLGNVMNLTPIYSPAESPRESPMVERRSSNPTESIE
eukprot:m.807723 g.807723  ORF g.807723 m.807723 type:complete len:577 (+) comp23380_c0_seq2:212-1942(+)